MRLQARFIGDQRHQRGVQMLPHTVSPVPLFLKTIPIYQTDDNENEGRISQIGRKQCPVCLSSGSVLTNQPVEVVLDREVSR
jgi:hypothetical protein